MNFYAYILSNNSMTLYVGVTNNLRRRVGEHRLGEGGAFTSRYHCHKLVWYERFGQAKDAIAREKQLKGWSRAKKIALVSSANSKWENLLGTGDDGAD